MTVEDYKEGQLIFIDKPLGWTSFQVVNKIRWLIKQQFKIKKNQGRTCRNARSVSDRVAHIVCREIY